MPGLKSFEHAQVALLAKHVPGGFIFSTWAKIDDKMDAFRQAVRNRRAISFRAITKKARCSHGERGHKDTRAKPRCTRLDSNANGAEESGICLWGMLHNVHVGGKARSR